MIYKLSAGLLISIVLLLPSRIFAYQQSESFRAASRGDSEVVSYALDKGQPINIRDLLGNTMLHLAAENGHSEVVQLLIMNKANINVVNTFGYTPLFSAVANHQQKTANLLISAGADFSIKNVYGSTVTDFVRSNGYQTVQSYLNNATINAKHGPGGYKYGGYWRDDVEQLIKDKKLDEAINKLINSAKSGDQDAQYLLGMLLYERFRKADALEWLQKSAQHGNIQAMFMVGKILTTDTELSNPKKGLQSLTNAATAGHMDAAVYVARAYILAIGTQQNYKIAEEYLKKPLENNYPDAIYWQGVIHYYSNNNITDNMTDNVTDNTTDNVTNKLPAMTHDNKLRGYEMIKKAAAMGSQDAKQHLLKFATEDSLLKIKKFNKESRAEIKTFFLSQNASLIESSDFCDIFSVEFAFHPDYGVNEIKLCYKNNDLTKTLKLSNNIDLNHRKWLSAFFADSNIVFDPPI